MADHGHAAVIGGQRCGSTLLARSLAKHPEIVLAHPVRPEPKFFLENSDHDEYHQLHFDGEGSVFLEKSTTYLERPDAESRMGAIPGGVWPIVILRDPVERAISNWRFTTEQGLESLPASEALTDSKQDRPFPPNISTSPYRYLDRSRYGSLLAPWIAARGFDGISIVILEALIESPSQVLASLHDVLGLSPVGLDALPVVNASLKDQDIEHSTVMNLRRLLRSDAEAIARIIPDVEDRWPTLWGGGW